MYETIILKMQEEIEQLKKRIEVLEKQLTNSKNQYSSESDDMLFNDAVRLVVQHEKASASLLQRRLSIGYARAARILDQLRVKGVIGPGEGSKPSDVLIKSFDEFIEVQKKQSS